MARWSCGYDLTGNVTDKCSEEGRRLNRKCQANATDGDIVTRWGENGRKTCKEYKDAIRAYA